MTEAFAGAVMGLSDPLESIKRHPMQKDLYWFLNSWDKPLSALEFLEFWCSLEPREIAGLILELELKRGWPYPKSYSSTRI